jgi:hypothetical protein
MLSRFGRSFGALSVAIIVGCGGTTDTTKTPAVDLAKKSGSEAKPASTADERKPAEAEAKAEKPMVTKERFALPNVKFTDPEERKQVVLGGKEISAEACLLDTSVPELKDEWFANALRGLAHVHDVDGRVDLVRNHDGTVRGLRFQLPPPPPTPTPNHHH